MPLEGYIDLASSTDIRGWVYDSDRPDFAVEIEILHGETIVGRISADNFRPDLQAAGKGNGKHAFHYEHSANTAPFPLVARAGQWLIPLGSFLSPSRYQGKFNHPLEHGIPQIETGFVPVPIDADDAVIVERLIAAYQRAIADEPGAAISRKDMWSNQSTSGHQEICEFLQRGDSAGVASYLRDAHSKSLTAGITQGSEVTGILRVRSDARQRVAAPFVDYLVSLAEYIGLLHVECSDQAATWGENLYRSPQDLVNRISADVGMNIVAPPVIGSLFGICTSTGILSGRDLLSLHTALRVREISKMAGIALPAICEIGGGLGGVAYYANRLGVANYTVIDLPAVNVLQGYYLSRALPNVSVQLYGEPSNDNPAIRILPTYCFDRHMPRFDILVNQDSMPEMHRDYSVGYLRSARNSPNHLFLSINQEAQAMQTNESRQEVVSQLIREAGGYKKLNRCRHWLRPGYVEEIYQSE